MTEAAKLTGTAAAPEAIRLSAGPLSLELDGGSVRYVRYSGHEAIRCVDYLVRDSSWRTPPARFTTIRREETADSFLVELDGEVQQDDIDYRFRLRIEGRADGRLDIAADAESHSGFLTNRTGFIVLHPIVGVAGRPVTVTHKDGSTSRSAFPELISPGQPIFDIRALRHEVAPGLFVTCRMEASLPHDAETIFEMEDQRNWTDASYKTYVGSLLDPWPYRIEKGARIAQKVSLRFEGSAAAAPGASGAASVHVGDAAAGAVPAIGLGLMPEHRAAILDAGHPALRLRPGFITAYVETSAPDLGETITDIAATAQALAAEVQLELVLPEGLSPEDEFARVAAALNRAGLNPARVIACPAPYLKSIQPVGPWPNVPDLGHIYSAARKAFPGAAILGGMLSYFTELNRKRPPPATIDGLSCTTTPIVHAADDRSVMETNEALPAIVASMAAIAPGKALHLGPSAIAMRHNPYGTATAPNPDGARIAMADDDPRQKALFAAAWSVAYAAAVAPRGLATLALNHLAGPSGVASPDGRLYPVFHVMAALAGAGGKPLLPVTVEGAGVAALGWREGGARRLLIANTGASAKMVNLPAGFSGRTLDLATVDAATADPAWSEAPGAPLGTSVSLGPYAVLFAVG